MDGVFVNIYWSIDEFFFLKSKLSLELDTRRLILMISIVLNRSNDFRCKSRKIANIRLVTLRVTGLRSPIQRPL